MSLILDALHKADKERQDNETPPGINTVHETPEFEHTQPKWFYPALIILVLLITALFAVWFFLSRQESEMPQETILNSSPPKTRSIPGLPKPILVEKENPSTINKSAVNELYKQQIKESASNENTAHSATATATKKDTAGATRTQENRLNRNVKVENTIQEEATVVAAPPTKAKKEKLNNFTNIGNISDLPWTVINSLPSLSYSSHTYIDHGSKKQVVINNQSKKEGQRLSENIKIEKILEDGVILEYQGHKFKLPALNSWVNI